MHKIKFTYKTPYCDRRHLINEEDVQVVLTRLPADEWARLRAVHFSDRSYGVRILGYANPPSGEISICALPPRVSLSRFLTPGVTCEEFGAVFGKQWNRLAMRRFLLYDVLLHELGHLKVIDKKNQKHRLKFAREKYAQEFADKWRRHLWSETFAHLDPVHNSPKYD